jgi:hypothetical protein
LALVGLLVAACTAASPAASPRTSSPEPFDSSEPSDVPAFTNPLGVVPADSMSLSVNNSTTLAVNLVVNGQLIAQLDPSMCLGCSADDSVPASLLPPLPWEAQVQTSAGRVLLALTVREGDVEYENSSSKGDASRVDLSCGRIDLWSGPPLDGPAAGPGTPGDCGP